MRQNARKQGGRRAWKIRRTGARTARAARRKSAGARSAARLAGRRALRWRREFDRGYSDGYRKGIQAGIEGFGTYFDGTSIVIPTYNQLGFLRSCIDSIVRHTSVPYEIIVVDNASTDGTEAFANKLAGKIRYRRLDANRGFAGAVNTGLMMARGTTIVVLNNDTLVTENWLSNMLACLNSDERIGMVGPVTNMISFDKQRVAAPYLHIRDLGKFAARHNQPDPSRWMPAERLIGFCLLFRRKLLEDIGYFDEGYEIGNFEDDDYSIRVRLLGRQLMIARDTFIHHFGSVSIRSLGDQIAQINRHNETYYSEKWVRPHELIQRVYRHELFHRHGGTLPDMRLLYPERVAVRGIGPTVYWIEDGVRRPVAGAITFPPVRVSQVDLRRWPMAEPIHADEVEIRWRGLNEQTGASVAVLPDGSYFHLEGNSYRRIIGHVALQAWNLHLKPQVALSPEQLARRWEGLPIIAPPQCRQQL